MNRCAKITPLSTSSGSDSWLAEYYWSDKHDPAASRSIAVELNGEDNFVSNVMTWNYKDSSEQEVYEEANHRGKW